MSARAMRRAREREIRREERRRSRLARRGIVGAGAVGAAVVFAPAAAAQAATFTVNTNADDHSPGVPANCESGSTTPCTLRDAAYAANSASYPGADTINFASSLNGQTITLGYGEIPISEALTITGPGAGQLTIDGDRDSRIFNASMASGNYGQPVSISGLTLQNGDAYAYGGAIYADYADLTVQGSVLRHNAAYAFDENGVGGAIDAIDGPVTITDSTLASNQAFSRYYFAEGGGVYLNESYSGTRHSLTITDSTLSGNTAYNGTADGCGPFCSQAVGGAVAQKYGDTTITGSTVRGNVAQAKYSAEGGGVWGGDGDMTIGDSTLRQNLASGQASQGAVGGGVYSYSGDLAAGIGDVAITGSTFAENTASGDGGGLVTVGDYSTLSVDGSTFDGNFSTDDGGGLDIEYSAQSTGNTATITDSSFTDNGATGSSDVFGGDGGAIGNEGTQGGMLIQRSTLSGNFADNGGGLYLDDPNGPVTTSDSTISGNSSGGVGGGIDSENYNGVPVTVQNSTVADNAANGGATSGGGIYRYAYNESGTPQGTGTNDVTISSSIVGDNSPADLGEGSNATPVPGSFITGFSLVQNPDSATVTESPAGTNVTGQDPQLGPLQDNGGPTQTQAPALTSPAIDAGTANGLSVDQRGDPRTVDQPNVANAPGSDGTDMGAVELARIPALPAVCKVTTANLIVGNDTNETLVGTNRADVILGGGGNDTMNGRRANDCLFGQQGRDVARGKSGKDLIGGGPQGDVLLAGNSGKDTIKGNGGKDRERGNQGNDKVLGNGGEDNLKGNSGNDKVKGNGGDDVVKGNRGNDKLFGNGGDDNIQGGAGNDTIKGGPGKDRINCGTGHDVVFADSKDVISDNCEVVHH